MRHYGAPSVKPTMIITNNKTFWALNPGKLSRSKRRGTKPTTRRYRDSNGKPRFSGTSRLKESQTLDVNLSNHFMVLLLYTWTERSCGNNIFMQKLERSDTEDLSTSICFEHSSSYSSYEAQCPYPGCQRFLTACFQKCDLRKVFQWCLTLYQKYPKYWLW